MNSGSSYRCINCDRECSYHSKSFNAYRTDINVPPGIPAYDPKTNQLLGYVCSDGCNYWINKHLGTNLCGHPLRPGLIVKNQNFKIVGRVCSDRCKMAWRIAESQKQGQFSSLSDNSHRPRSLCFFYDRCQLPPSVIHS
jgi:hypothetical protein